MSSSGTCVSAPCSPATTSYIPQSSQASACAGSNSAPTGCGPASTGFSAVDGFTPNGPVTTVSVPPADSTKPVDPAADLFPNLDWLDPLKYHTADRSTLPANQPSEKKIVEEAQASRTPDGVAAGIYLANHGQFGIWQHYLSEYRQHAGTLKGIEGTALLDSVMAKTGLQVAFEKLKYHEPRPYDADPVIHNLGGNPGGSSYPSGHAAEAYAAATVLSYLWPERSEEFMAAAANVARSRIYIGDHFAGDVAAGARLGEESAQQILALG